MRPRCLLLDRDGVINIDSTDYILSVDEWQPIPGSLEAIAQLTHAGVKVAVCTNQSAVGRGMLSEEMLERIHQHMREAVTAAGGQLSGIFFCPHSPEARCNCRKPAPGLIQQALQHLGCAEEAALFIGDSQRDLEAARSAGVEAWLVRTGNGRETEASLDEAMVVYDDLASAAKKLVSGVNRWEPPV
ncbi:D-glycero-beta-D-manno-heptose 1,7-bisphosphate 7-phosphatase [Spiribacter insolitus]|uniref:D,D-heptose 1,7-bisphosphate phosphatase n=1 Tax=Spiribacter insolitus TaxID=3122417 RepID=A0ABV3T9W2_9GAMM